MVQAIIDISDHTNQVLNIIKAKYNLKDKSGAIELAIKQYEDQILGPELRPEFITKLQNIKKQKGIRFKNVEELRKHIENA